MKKSLSLLSLIVILIFVSSMFMGCGGQSPETNANSSSVQDGTTAAPTTAIAAEPVKISIAMRVHADDKVDVSLPWFQELMKRTNVNLEIIPLGDAEVLDQKRNLMLASGEIPDLMSVSDIIANTYGNDGIFIPVDDLLKENAPDIMKGMDYNQTLPIRNPKDNKLYFVPRYYELSGTCEYSLNYRKDILDAMGLSEPKNMDEWYNTFKAVKEKYPDIIPLCERGRYIFMSTLSAFDMAAVYPAAFSPAATGRWGMIGSEMDKKQIVYLPATDNWKEFLMYFNKLYKEKLLDNEYLTIEYANWWDGKITAGKAFACWTMNFNRDHEGNLEAATKGVTQNYVTALYPENNSGKRQIFLAVNPWVADGMAISADSKCAKEAVVFLNYLYTEEGNTLFQYGLEGVTYKNDGGNPVKLPEGNLDEFNKKRAEIGTAFYMPTAQKIKDQVDLTAPVIKDFFDKTPALLVKLPNIRPTATELEDLNNINADLNAYVEAMMDKFIIGKESFDNWDKYLKEIERLGAGKCTGYVQKWLDDYYASGK